MTSGRARNAAQRADGEFRTTPRAAVFPVNRARQGGPHNHRGLLSANIVLEPQAFVRLSPAP